MTPGWSPRVCVARVGPRCSAFAVGGLVLGGWGCASGTAGGAGGHARTALEVGAQAVAALSVDDETRGGGVGAAVELSLPLRDLPSLGGQLLVRARAGALTGGGVAWLLDAGAAYRLGGFRHWQPDAGVSLAAFAGDLVRSIDDAGELSGDPVAIQLGLNPLRFMLSSGWVSALGLKLGPTLFRDGSPPLAVSATLFEVGSQF